MNPMDEVTLSKIVLDWKKFELTQTVTEETIQGIEMAAERGPLNHIMLRFTKDLLTDKRAEDTYAATLRVPATWRDHWKADHGLTWLGPLWMRRWPVRYREETAWIRVERLQTYPLARLDRERFGRAVIVEDVHGPWWEA